MKRIIFICLFWFTSAFCQFALIQDIDGYTNIREKPDAKSKIIHKVYNNEVFIYNYEIYLDSAKWVPVYLQPNDFSLGLSKSKDIKGYIHRSRIKPLEQLTPYNGNNFKFEYKIEKFDSTNRIIERQDREWIISIDGRPVWGTDGDYPRHQVNDVDVILDGKKIPINRVFYSDIYDCDNRFKIYKYGEIYIIHQSNSDGAGYYEIVWVISEKGILQRLISHID